MMAKVVWGNVSPFAMVMGSPFLSGRRFAQ